jgi:hypothetical protein
MYIWPKQAHRTGLRRQMEAERAIERVGIVDARHQLVLDEPLPIAEATRVRVIVLFADDTEIGEEEWLHAATTNPSFEFLKDPAEDIYTIEDGKPFHDQG